MSGKYKLFMFLASKKNNYFYMQILKMNSMKNNFLKPVLFLLIFIVFIFSCSTEDNENVQNADEEVSIEQITVEEIYKELSKAEFPQNWNEDFLDSGTSFKGITLSPEEVNSLNYMDNDFEGSDATFLWKYETSDWKLVCVKYFFFDANYYWLMTLNEDFGMIDELKFAADEAVRVENEFGGTSTGIEYYTAVLELKDGTVFIDSEEGNYFINNEGVFSKTVNYIDPKPIDEFSNLFKAGADFPLDIDSVFIAEVSASLYKPLKAEHLKTLFTNGKDLENFYGSWSVKACIIIDSLKQANLYEEFLQGDNSGEIEYSDAFALNILKFDGRITAYIWAISEATAESGPYSSGTNIYISFADNNKIISSYMIAELSSGGDSPMWSETIITATIYENAEIDILKTGILGDDDAETEEKTTDSYNYVLENGKLIDMNEN